MVTSIPRSSSIRSSSNQSSSTSRSYSRRDSGRSRSGSMSDVSKVVPTMESSIASCRRCSASRVPAEPRKITASRVRSVRISATCPKLRWPGALPAKHVADHPLNTRQADRPEHALATKLDDRLVDPPGGIGVHENRLRREIDDPVLGRAILGVDLGLDNAVPAQRALGDLDEQQRLARMVACAPRATRYRNVRLGLG